MLLLILKLCVWVSFFIFCMLFCLHFKYFFLLGTPYPSHIPLPLWGCYVIHPSTPGIPLLQGNEHPQAQGPLLPLMSNKAIFCHICTQSHGSLRMYSLVGGPVTVSSGGGLFFYYLWIDLIYNDSIFSLLKLKSLQI